MASLTLLQSKCPYAARSLIAAPEFFVKAQAMITAACDSSAGLAARSNLAGAALLLAPVLGASA